MRQAHKEMNSATAAALTAALVWSRILDAMLVRAQMQIQMADQG
jgi:hypothetical protein